MIYFNQSPLATTELEKKQSELKKDGTTFPTLQQDVATRWNNTYFMIQTLLQNKGPLSLLLGDRKVIKSAVATKLELAKEEWHHMEQLVECLKPFDVTTKQMSAELYPTLGSVYPLVRGIMKRYLKKNDEEDRTEILQGECKKSNEKKIQNWM